MFRGRRCFKGVDLPGLPFSKAGGKVCDEMVANSPENLGRPLLASILTTSVTGRGGGRATGTFLLLDTAAAIPPPTRAPAVKTAACIIAAPGILSELNIDRARRNLVEPDQLRPGHRKVTSCPCVLPLGPDDDLHTLCSARRYRDDG